MKQQKRHILIVLFCLASLLALCMALAACGGKTMYSVKIADYDTTQGTVTVTPKAEDDKYEEGTELTVTVKANSGYELDSFKISADNSAALNGEGKYTFKVTADATITVTFKATTLPPVEEKFTLTVPASVDNGTVKVEPESADGKYAKDTEITVTLTPAQGYEVDTFKVDGVDKKADLQNNVYKFNITADTAISVTFKQTTTPPVEEKFTLTVPASVDNGTVKVKPESADNKYAKDTEITVTLTPAQGYEVATFTVGGVDKKAELKDGVYKFNITADTAIDATFKAQQFTVTTTVTGETEQGSIALSLKPTEGKYAYGTKVTVTVTAKSGYGITPDSFKVSTDPDAELVDGEYTFTITADTTISVAIHQHEYSDYEVDTDRTYHNAYCDVCDYYLHEYHGNMLVVTSFTADSETHGCRKCGCEFKNQRHSLKWVDNGEGQCHQVCQNTFPKCSYETELRPHDMKWECLDQASDGHSGVCKNCGNTVEKEAHDANGEGGACSKCGYKNAGEHTCVDNSATLKKDGETLTLSDYKDGLCDICEKQLETPVWMTSSGGKLTLVPSYQSDSNYKKIVVPESVVGLTYKTVAFAGNTNITHVIVPERIGLGAAGFNSCSSLQSVVILGSLPNGTTLLFGKCASLKTIVLSASVTELTGNIFGSDTLNKDVTYNSALTIYSLGSQLTVKEQGGTTSYEKSNKHLMSAKLLYYKADGSEADEGYWHWDVDKVTPKPWKED